VAFTGDAFFLPNPRNDGTMRHNLIFRNHVESDSHMKSIRNLIEHDPELICPGHGRAYPVDQKTMLATEQKMRRQEQLFADLLPEGETNFGLDPSWVSIYPYQPILPVGKPGTLQIRVRNYYREPMTLDAVLVVPPEWRVTPEVAKLKVPAGSTATAKLEVNIPRGWQAPGPRFAIAADVMRNGKYLGQITEAVVELVEA
jgi:hypothetical protein